MNKSTKINQAWDIINKGLTRINIVFAVVLFQMGFPRKYENRTIPLIANIILLLILVSVLVYFIHSYGSNTHEVINLSGRAISVHMTGENTTTLN